MIKKVISLILITILLIGILIPLKDVYATDKFFEIESKEVLEQEEIELIINLEKIVYNKFEFKLVSDTELSNITCDENISIENDENEVSINIDKDTIDLEKIILKYKIPEDKKVGDNIIFTASITNLDNEDENQTEEIEINIIEKENEKENEQNQIKQENSEKDDNIANLEKRESTIDNNEQTQSLTTKQNSDTDIKQTSISEEVTYNGSNNNYLANLAIDGYDLNKVFCKDSNTYFASVDNTVSSINIITEKEEDTSTVYVYGNEELKEGINKVLINVTAQNGNVRTYRIYVTKQ